MAFYSRNKTVKETNKQTNKQQIIKHFILNVV